MTDIKHKIPAKSVYRPEPGLTPEEVKELADMDIERKGRIGPERALGLGRRTFTEYEQSLRRRKLRNFVKGIVLIGALSGVGASVGVNFYFSEENKRLKQNIIKYEQILGDLKNEIGNLIALNEKVIVPLEQKVGDLEKKMGSRGILGPVERAIGGINLFNKNTPVFGQSDLEKLIKTVEGQSANPDEIFADFQIRTHGINLYEQKISGFGSLIIGNKDKMVVQQDIGDTVYILVLNSGIHKGVDVNNVELKNAASTRAYASFKAKILEDYIHPAKGRTLFFQAVDLKDENGNFLGAEISHWADYNTFPKYKNGAIIEKEQFAGYLGYTGFMNGLHLHQEFYLSKSGKPGTWKLFNPYKNKTYEQNIVWFNLDTIPHEILDVVRRAVK